MFNAILSFRGTIGEILLSTGPMSSSFIEHKSDTHSCDTVHMIYKGGEAFYACGLPHIWHW